MKTTSSIITLLCYGLITYAQIPNAKTETVHIAGNCDMCKSAIETSAGVKNEASASWNPDNQQAEITYDSAVTSLDDVLKRVAYVGYDSDHYLAPAEAYQALEACCQYERAQAALAVTDVMEKKADAKSNIDDTASVEPVYQDYLALKDALITGKTANVPSLAIKLADHLDALSAPEAKKAAAYATEVAGEKSIARQRSKFALLSEAMYAVAKANPPSLAIYYQHCPMYNSGKGAHWLSRDKEIRNPYYGETMLTCGTVVETLR